MARKSAVIATLMAAGAMAQKDQALPGNTYEGCVAAGMSGLQGGDVNEFPHVITFSQGYFSSKQCQEAVWAAKGTYAALGNGTQPQCQYSLAGESPKFTNATGCDTLCIPNDRDSGRCGGSIAGGALFNLFKIGNGTKPEPTPTPKPRPEPVCEDKHCRKIFDVATCGCAEEVIEIVCAGSDDVRCSAGAFDLVVSEMVETDVDLLRADIKAREQKIKELEAMLKEGKGDKAKIEEEIKKEREAIKKAEETLKKAEEALKKADGAAAKTTGDTEQKEAGDKKKTDAGSDQMAGGNPGVTVSSGHQYQAGGIIGLTAMALGLALL